MDNPYLINVAKNKFRGTDKVIRIASIDAVLKDERFTLGCIPKYPLDGIDKAKEVDISLRKTIKLGIDINFVLIDKEYFDAGVLEKNRRSWTKIHNTSKIKSKNKDVHGISIKMVRKESLLLCCNK